MRFVKQVNLRKRGELPAPSADASRAVNALLLVLSVIARCTDVIGYVGLDGLFTSHFTGNRVLLAAHVDGGQARVSKLLAVPVYLAVVGLTTLLSDLLRSLGAPLRLLLLLQFLLLTGFLGVCVTAGARIDPHAANAILAGMLGVSAMAVQNALIRSSHIAEVTRRAGCEWLAYRRPPYRWRVRRTPVHAR
jgi:uncharacterized membrane protein YoaK (UPF0700 family)